MGACISCLGLDRRRSQSDQPSDTSQLLGEQYQPHYGTTIAQGTSHPDSEEIRRQRDALERLCAQTSDKLIDVSQPLHLADTADGGLPLRPNLAHDFPRLFKEVFQADASPTAHSRSASVNHAHSSRGSSSAPSIRNADAEGDEATWLLNAVRQHEQEVGRHPQGVPPWDRMIGDWQGKLVFNFDDVMGGGAHQTLRVA